MFSSESSGPPCPNCMRSANVVAEIQFKLLNEEALSTGVYGNSLLMSTKMLISKSEAGPMSMTFLWKYTPLVLKYMWFFFDNKQRILLTVL